MKFHWKIVQNQEDRIRQIPRDERVGIAGNKNPLMQERGMGRAFRWPLGTLNKASGPQSSQMSREAGELHTSCHSRLAPDFYPTLFCKQNSILPDTIAADICSLLPKDTLHFIFAIKSCFLIHENVMILPPSTPSPT